MPTPSAAPLCLALLLGALAAHAQTTDSPFLPAGGTEAAATEATAVLELRGLVVDASGPLFNLVDVSSKKGAWVGLQESGHEFVVTGYDAQEGNESATVSYRGQALRLPLAKGRVGAAAPGVAPAAIAAGKPAQALPPVSPVVLNPTPADEARRLDAVAAELRRRREQRQLERQQVRQAQNQGPTGAPPPAQQQP
ncbi:MAG TPA: hypothetical protein PKY36_13735 [Opitutaceae bacterium]|nr:hypothetical protein [Opitutaceae bacterium]